MLWKVHYALLKWIAHSIFVCLQSRPVDPAPLCCCTWGMYINTGQDQQDISQWQSDPVVWVWQIQFNSSIQVSYTYSLTQLQNMISTSTIQEMVNVIELAISVAAYLFTCNYLSEGWAASCKHAHSYNEKHPSFASVPRYCVEWSLCCGAFVGELAIGLWQLSNKPWGWINTLLAKMQQVY